MRIVSLKQNSPEWLEWRRSGIGSSDIPALMGKSPYSTALKVYNDKAGLSYSYMNKAMERGKAYEEEARSHFCRIRGNQFEPLCATHDDYDFLIASLDGYNEQENSLLEIKVPSKSVLEDCAMGIIPDHYYLQMQWQLLVSGAERGFFCCYSPEDQRLVTTAVDPDVKVYSQLFSVAFSFWKDFMKGIPPEETAADVDIIDDPEFGNVSFKYIALCDEIAKLERAKDAFKKELLSYGKGKSFKGFGLSVTQVQPRASYDMKAMEKAGIDIKAYLKPGKEEQSYRISVEKK